MKHWQFSKDGGFREYEFDTHSLYIYQRMRTKDNKIINTAGYLEILNDTYMSLTGNNLNISVKNIDDICSRLLSLGNYSTDACHIIELAHDLEENFAMRVVETSIYKSLSVRAVRPVAQAYLFSHDELNLPTSAGLNANELFRHMAKMQGYDIPVYIDIDNNVTSVDGASPIIVKGKNITINPTMESVETLTVLEALNNLPNYTLHFEPFSLFDAQEADEFFYVDYRGITSIGSMSDHIYTDNVPQLAVRALNFNMQ